MWYHEMIKAIVIIGVCVFVVYIYYYKIKTLKLKEQLEDKD